MEMTSQKSSNVSSRRKPTVRKRSSSSLTKKVQQNCVINMAEARREIAHALHLHRLSSSSSSSCHVEPTIYMLGNTCNSKYYYHSLVESMPLPGPTWSTTAPSTHAAPPQPPPPPAAVVEGLELFDWGENQEASSYTWWLGFLEALDAKNVEKLKQPLMLEVFGRHHHHHHDGSKVVKGPPPISNGGKDQLMSSLDEWLMFPTIEDPSEQL